MRNRTTGSVRLTLTGTMVTSFIGMCFVAAFPTAATEPDLSPALATRAVELCTGREADARSVGSLGDGQLAIVRKDNSAWTIDPELRAQLGERWLPYGDALFCLEPMRRASPDRAYATVTWHLHFLQAGAWTEAMFTTVVDANQTGTVELMERVVLWLKDNSRGDLPATVLAQQTGQEVGQRGERQRGHAFAGRFRADRLVDPASQDDTTGDSEAEPTASSGGRDRGNATDERSGNRRGKSATPR